MKDNKNLESMKMNFIPHTMNRFTYLLVKDFKPKVSEPLKLNRTHGKTLMVLYLKGSHTMSELVHHMNIEKGSMTSVVDCLIEKKLVLRERDSKDRRRVIISLTERGAELSRTIGIEMNNHIQNKLDQLGDKNKDAIENLVAKLKNCIDIWENEIET